MTSIDEGLVPPVAAGPSLAPAGRRRRIPSASPLRVLIAVVGAVALFAPAVVSEDLLATLTAIGILGLFAMSLDLVLGYGGLPTLGHAMFFGIGGYVAGVMAVRQTSEVLVTLPLAMVAGAVGGYLVARLALRTQALQFLMITFAFSGLVLAGIDRLDEYTGGNDGLSGIPATEVAGRTLDTPEGVYLLVLVVLAASAWVMRRIVCSAFGRVVIGIRDNPVRVRAVGIDPDRRLAALFALGAMFAAAAGVLHVAYYKFMSPSSAGFVMAADGLFMVIIGGAGTLGGALLGAGVVHYVREELVDVTTRSNLVLGVLFVVFVLVVRGGLVGLVRRLVDRVRAARPGATGATDVVEPAP